MPTSAAPTNTSSSASASPSLSPSGRARQVLAGLDEAHRVGQLFMINASASVVDQDALDAAARYHLGGLYLGGKTGLGVAQTAALTRALQRGAGAVPLLISADQEGGDVQRFTGPGFSDIPTALQQGRLAPSVLQADATRWGAELAGAGVNLDLAPVADTVPSPTTVNPPIAGFDREYGFDPATVAAHATAFAAGLRATGVAATAKHFPGLGRVSANTDIAAGVTDTVTTRNDPYLAPFAALVRDGVPVVMISSARYTRIDPAQPAAFSSTVITGMLRGDLGFGGVVISDDLNAVQVRAIPAADRAVAFLGAGGDIVLDLQNADIGPMTTAVLARAGRDTTFRAQVDAAALRVLQAKERLGLLG